MSNAWQERQLAQKQKALEIETRSYKTFMKVAKRVSNLQYGQWKIIPDMNDPLRKFVLEKDAGWFTIRYQLFIESFYHRAVYTDERTDYRAKIQQSGLYAYNDGGNWVHDTLNLGVKLKPRMARKLIEMTDQVIIPKLYAEIQREKEEQDRQRQALTTFQINTALIPHLVVMESSVSYDPTPRGVVKDCPFSMKLEHGYVQMEGRLTYDQVGRIVDKMGWGK